MSKNQIINNVETPYTRIHKYFLRTQQSFFIRSRIRYIVKGYFYPFFFVSNKFSHIDNSGNAIVMITRKTEFSKSFYFCIRSTRYICVYVSVIVSAVVSSPVEIDVKLMRCSARSGVSSCIDGATDAFPNG